MSLSPSLPLYLALALYAAGTLIALAALFIPEKKLQHSALLFMIGGFVAHTVWIGTICARTGHPPLTNLPETASFIAWTIFAVELALYIRYRVYAAAFFVYPLVFGLLVLSAVVGERFAVLEPKLRSNVFTIHLLMTTLGVAALFIGLAFGFLAFLQDRALKAKTRGRLWEWIPSLNVCKTVSYRALSIGFAIYTIGLIAGVLWSYRTTAGLMAPSVKEIGAVVAWVLFAVILQSYINNTYRTRRTMYLSAFAFIATMVAMLGIRL